MKKLNRNQELKFIKKLKKSFTLDFRQKKILKISQKARLGEINKYLKNKGFERGFSKEEQNLYQQYLRRIYKSNQQTKYPRNVKTIENFFNFKKLPHNGGVGEMEYKNTFIFNPNGTFEGVNYIDLFNQGYFLEKAPYLNSKGFDIENVSIQPHNFYGNKPNGGGLKEFLENCDCIYLLPYTSYSNSSLKVEELYYSYQEQEVIKFVEEKLTLWISISN